jgi:hypothetical protein
LTALLFSFSSCSQKYTVRDADDVTIFYGVSSYAMFGTDKETLKLLTNAFDGLTFEKTDQKTDVGTMLTVNFYKDKKTVAVFMVDSGGIFLIDDEYYKVSSGKFDYNTVYNIYLNSRNNTDHS